MKIWNGRVSLWMLASLFFLGAAFFPSPLALATRELSMMELPGGLPWLLDMRMTPVQAEPGSGQFLLGERAVLSDLAAGKSQSFELFGPAEKQAIEESLPLSLPFRNAIETTAERYQLDSRLLAAIVEAESNFDPRAISPRGAVGLTQVLPATGGIDSNKLHDPETNLNAGARYLRALLDQYEGQTQLALAAYNAGPGRVKRYGGVPPFGETRRYVQKVMELYEQHQQGDWRSEAPEMEPATP